MPIGIWEIALLLVFAVLLFGAKKLPLLARSAGKGMREFKGSVTSFKKPIEEVSDLVTLEEVKDIAALRSPKRALGRILIDRPDEAKKDDVRTKT